MKKYFYLVALTTMSLMLTAFTFGSPFRASKELDQLSPETMVTVGITHVTTGDDSKKNDIFWQYTYAVIDSLASHKGYLGHKIRKQIFGSEAWTMTVWKDEASLNAFVRGDMHSQAIQNGLDAVAKARFVRLTIERSKIPLSWAEAEKIMTEKGRDLYGKE